MTDIGALQKRNVLHDTEEGVPLELRLREAKLSLHRVPHGVGRRGEILDLLELLAVGIESLLLLGISVERAHGVEQWPQAADECHERAWCIPVARHDTATLGKDDALLELLESVAAPHIAVQLVADRREYHQRSLERRFRLEDLGHHGVERLELGRHGSCGKHRTRDSRWIENHASTGVMLRGAGRLSTCAAAARGSSGHGRGDIGGVVVVGSQARSACGSRTTANDHAIDALQQATIECKLCLLDQNAEWQVAQLWRPIERQALGEAEAMSVVPRPLLVRTEEGLERAPLLGSQAILVRLLWIGAGKRALWPDDLALLRDREAFLVQQGRENLVPELRADRHTQSGAKHCAKRLLGRQQIVDLHRVQHVGRKLQCRSDDTAVAA